MYIEEKFQIDILLLPAPSGGYYVKKVHLRFLPNMKKSYPLDSKTLREKASIIDLDVLAGVKKESDDDDDDNP